MNENFTLKWMKILPFIFLSIFLCHATLSAQDLNRNKTLSEIKVSIHLKDASAAQLFKELQKQTNFYFVYNSDDLEKVGRVTYTKSNVSIKELLDEILSKGNLTYNLSEDNVIIIKPRATQPQSEKRKLSGQVFFNSAPFGNVYVTEKGTDNRTLTNSVGEWSLNVDRNKDVVFQFTHVGFESLELKVNASERLPNLIISMVLSALNVEEIVITGYERVDKRKSTGSVATIKSEELMEPTGITVDKMLQGKLAGVSVTQNTSTPGAAPKIRIRGNSTIMGNREPIWVVDGIIMDAPVQVPMGDLNSLDNINLIGNAISFLNPNDIERIDVLKDVSATAIYGVKAANGVIVVTTKRGKKGTVSVSYSTNLSVKERPSYNRLNLMNSNDRIAVSEEIANRGLSFTSISAPKVGYEGLLQDFWDKKISYDQFNRGVDNLRGNNTDWFDELFRSSFSHNHNLSISGGSDKTNYYVSGSYANDKDAQINTNVERFTISTNLDFNFNEKLSLTVGLSASHSTGKRTHSSIDLLNYAYQTSRVLDVRNDDGTLSYYPLKKSQLHEETNIDFNIFNELNNTGYNDKNTALNLNLNLTYKILPFLSSNTIFGYNMSQNAIDEYVTEQSYYASDMREVPYGTPIPDYMKIKTDLPFGGILDQNRADNNVFNIRETFALNKRFNNDFLDVQIGGEARGSKYSGSKYKTLGYLPDRGKQIVVVPLNEYQKYGMNIENNIPYFNDNQTNSLSLYGLIRYSFSDKYSLNTNIRYDGSNKFGQSRSNRFLPVWSVSGRWNLHNERFMKGVHFLDEFGIKASYGIQGNVVDTQTPNMIANLGKLDGETQQYISTISSFPNPNLEWEKTYSYQVGVDFSIFRGVVSGTFEYYDKTGRQQIVTNRVEPTNGIDVVLINGGTMYNKGWELGLNFQLLRKSDWSWSLSANVSQNTNKIKDTQNDRMVTYSDYVYGSVLKNGESINSFYSYQFAGLDPNTGLPTFAGVDFYHEDGTSKVKSMEEAYNYTFIYSGRRDPKLSGGFSTNLRYKSLSFNANFAFALGHKVRLSPLYKESGQQLPLPSQNWSSDFKNRWQKPGDVTDIPVLSDQRLDATSLGYSVGENFWQMYNQSDLRVVSGDYLRCTSASIAYTFSNGVARKIGAKGLSCSLGCNNLFVIANSKLNGQDPEQISGNTRTIPPQRTYSFSLNINF